MREIPFSSQLASVFPGVRFEELDERRLSHGDYQASRRLSTRRALYYVASNALLQKKIKENKSDVRCLILVDNMGMALLFS